MTDHETRARIDNLTERRTHCDTMKFTSADAAELASLEGATALIYASDAMLQVIATEDSPRGAYALELLMQREAFAAEIRRIERLA